MTSREGQKKSCNRILVTGGAGFIGSHLVDALDDGRVRMIYVLDNLSSGHESNLPTSSRVRFVYGDVRDAELLDPLVRKSDLIFHLAEYIPETRFYGSGHVVRYSTERPLHVFDTECRGTLVLLEKAKRYRKKIVFTSSAAVYGEPESVPVKEDSDTMPTSPYGAAKLCSEIHTRVYAKLYDLPTVTVRLFNVYGSRQTKYIMYDLLLRLRSNRTKLKVYGTGREKRDFIFVKDAVRAILLAAHDSRAEGSVLNVGTGTGTSTSQIVQIMTGILNIEPDVVFTKKSWKGDIKRIVADVSRINRLGFRPKYRLREGIAELVSWFSATS